MGGSRDEVKQEWTRCCGLPVSSQATGSSVARATRQGEIVSTRSSEAESALEQAMTQFWAWAEPYMIAYHARQLREARGVRCDLDL
jgi:hypothetical protein